MDGEAIFIKPMYRNEIEISVWFGLAVNVAVERDKTKRAEIECGV